MSNYFKHIQMPNGDIIEVDTRDCANIDLSNLSDTGKEYIKKNVASFPLFYRIISDYVLTGVEAKGKLLQGSLVTNLYSDAVAHVKADWDNGTIQTFTLDDITFEYKLAQDKHLIVDIANKTQVDNLFAKTGIAEFYILDYANNQFYLPRNLWFDQYTNDPEQVNKYNEAGLPDAQGQIYDVLAGNLFSASGMYDYSTIGSNDQNSGGFRRVAIDTSLASANPIYGKSNTVQPPSSNKLLYFVVGNTYVNQEDIDLAQVESELNQVKNELDLKLNITLDNATQTTKDVILSWGSLNYDAGIIPVSGEVFVPDSYGAIIAYPPTSARFREFYINLGTQLTSPYIACFSGAGGTNSMSSVAAFLNKGEQYWVQYTNSTVMFYPYKGV